VELCT